MKNSKNNIKLRISALVLVLVLVSSFFLGGCSNYWANVESHFQTASIRDDSQTFEELEFFHDFFKTYSYYDIDEKTIMTAVLKAYAEATGDRYAAYYTKEELEKLMQESAGEVYGIGVSVIYNEEYKAPEIISIQPDTPADESDLEIGDIIISVGLGEDAELVSEIGYNAAIEKVKGPEGTLARFTVLRGSEYIDFEITRVKITAEEVTYKVCATDPSVGIVKITGFELLTPSQFCNAIEALKNENCDKFVFDLRSNPGGDLKSVAAMISYFLNEGDVMIYTVDKKGNKEHDNVKVVKYTDEYAGCSVAKEDIGKYRDLNFVILCDGNTASAAELFTANMRDYHLATIVGTKTFGKGIMQSIYSLEYFGYEGGVKLTTREYLPPCGEGYHGMGIIPDVEVEMSEEAKKINIYKLPHADDNQLQAAIAELYK